MNGCRGRHQVDVERRLSLELDALRAPIVRRILAIRADTTDRAEQQASLFDRRSARAATARDEAAGRRERALSRTLQAIASPSPGARTSRADRGVAGETSVIAGFGGGLISHAYLEEHLPADIEAARDVGFERRTLRWWRGVSRALGPASSARAVLDIAVAPLLELLRHEPARDRSRVVRPSRIAPIRERSAARTAVGVAAHVRHGATRFARDWPRERDWAIITNGRSLRIADCTRSWTRAGIEFDFERLLLSPRGVAVLWALANAGAMSGAAPRTLRSRVTDSDAHASRVCRSLSDGVLGALPLLAASLEPGRSTHGRRAIAFDQSLTIVYRVLFLLFAEAHALVPVWNELYREAYTIDALTDRAVQSIAAWAVVGAAGDLAPRAFGMQGGRSRRHRIQRPAVLTAPFAA